MIERTPIIPILPMARVLAAHGTYACADYRLAAPILQDEGYTDDDIVAGLADAMAYGAELAAAAASDRPLWQALGYARDLVSFAVVTYGAVLAWGVLS